MNPLQPQLDAIDARTRELVPAARLEPTEKHIQELIAEGRAERILQPGAAMPAFALEDSRGRTVDSSDLLALGPLVVLFFRGRWCPYCVTELEAWRDAYESLRSEGALLISLTPQTVRQNDFLVEQHRLPYPVLRDQACAVAEKFGVAYTLPETMQRHYRSMLVNIPFINGEQSYKLPMPAVFVADSSGVVRFSETHADFRRRTEPQAVLDAIAAI
jgi:peroxiredoxin